MFSASESLWLAETNTYVVAADTGGPCVVIDTPPDVEGVAQLLKKHDLYPEAVLLTHGHIDHMGGSGALFDAVGAVTYIHPDDDFLTLNPEAQIRGMMGGTLPGSFEAPVERVGLFHGQKLNFAGLIFEAPKDAEVTTHPLADGAQVIAVTRREEVLLIATYSGRRAPAAKVALATHREELEEREARGSRRDLQAARL